MKHTPQTALKRLAVAASFVFVGAMSFASMAQAQNLFDTAIKVNDLSITQYEIDQRARMLSVFRAPGDPVKLAREQLIEDRLKIDAANSLGFQLEPEQIEAGMEEFASRVNLSSEELIQGLSQQGVDPLTFREFVAAGLTWREFTQARFGSRVSVDEDDIERARNATSGTSGVRVLLSEIILPVQPGQEQQVQELANRISEFTSEAQFAQAAREFSASRTAAQGGRMDWIPITQLPQGLQAVALGLGPGDVSDPLPLEGAVALFQLRDIQETEAPNPEYEAIEYAAYYINGGRSDQALARARQIANDVDTCDDLYGVAFGQPPEVLERGSKAINEIPSDIALELAKLDRGEVSYSLTRANGQTLVVLMLCGRVRSIEGEGPSAEQLTNFISSRRLESFANGFLEQLRAEARIVEF
ncbi:peptidylprolyl isomerase [Roseovarius rhodophyticola]|uniref:Parvulin-like PPIase n=1 Tax=Roseovarius rhodophyticola TaxID=3080827 RepID=A0ABZ2TEZ1_9RHOB|nr:peptidylprolyl isomerase [Roseovarius sp. W115]MDV2928492.1 peptidylprolyl isomerase [Roseovarius sp. W115]